MCAPASTWPLAGMRLRPALFTSPTHESCTVINLHPCNYFSFPLQNEQSQQPGHRVKPQQRHPDVFGCSSICPPTADLCLSSQVFQLICCLPLLQGWDKQMLPPSSSPGKQPRAALFCSPDSGASKPTENSFLGLSPTH